MTSQYRKKNKKTKEVRLTNRVMLPGFLRGLRSLNIGVGSSSEINVAILSEVVLIVGARVKPPRAEAEPYLRPR